MRTTTFRWTLAASGAFAACLLLMFGFVLAQAYAYMTADVDRLVGGVANFIAADGPEARLQKLNEHLRLDPRHAKLAGLFAADGSRIAGNIEAVPSDLHPDASAQLVSLVKLDGEDRLRQTVRAVARRLPEGGSVVVARTDYEFAWIANIMERALALGLIPALCLGLAT